jgi:signal transduction histidine kinase
MTEKELQDMLDIFAHKLKNPLHGMGINLDVLRAKLRKQFPEDDPVLKHLEIVTTESRRVQDITLTFLDYLKQSESKRKKIDLRELLEGGKRGK